MQKGYNYCGQLFQENKITFWKKITQLFRVKSKPKPIHHSDHIKFVVIENLNCNLIEN